MFRGTHHRGQIIHFLERHGRFARRAVRSPPYRTRPQASRTHQERATPRILHLQTYELLIPKLGLRLHRTSQVVCADCRVRLGGAKCERARPRTCPFLPYPHMTKRTRWSPQTQGCWSFSRRRSIAREAASPRLAAGLELLVVMDQLQERGQSGTARLSRFVTEPFKDSLCFFGSFVCSIPSLCRDPSIDFASDRKLNVRPI